MTLDLIQIARACHTANVAIQIATHDPEPSPDWWDDLPQSQRDIVVEGVKAALGGATPEQLHQAWVNAKTAAGWNWGETKDDSLLTHPALLPYDELPAAQKAKDVVFHTIVFAFRTGYLQGQDAATADNDGWWDVTPTARVERFKSDAERLGLQIRISARRSA